ncbi:MAG: beta-ketoacyl-ACP synthase I, partial [Pseudomonadales bacterium]|nr:beta-ketoacyl-ACP synthase I [Pseudomonadales bacterium]
RCMEMAMSTVNGSIDYINAHGTSTPVGDAAEIGAVMEVFGDNMPAVSSTKSLTGHSLGAAGVQEAIYSLIMLENDFITASANVNEIDEKIQGANIAIERVDNAGLQRVMSNSFGFGGTNGTLVFERFNK